MLIRTRLKMKIIMVDINARHKYRIIRFGTLYDAGRWSPADNFLRSIGRFDEYEPDVSRDEAGEDW